MLAETIIILLRLDAIDRILICCAPALDDDGCHCDGTHYKQGEGEKPPVNGCTLNEALEPLMTDVPSQGCGNDETDCEQPAIVAAEHEQNFPC